jgi:hypothetical protein
MKELARQMTYIEYELFSRIRISELLNKRFEKPHLRYVPDEFNLEERKRMMKFSFIVFYTLPLL